MKRRRADLKQELLSIIRTQQAILDALMENGLPNKEELIKRIQETALEAWLDKIGLKRDFLKAKLKKQGKKERIKVIKKRREFSDLLQAERKTIS